jgi:hypothetical protein
MADRKLGWRVWPLIIALFAFAAWVWPEACR